MASDRVQKLLPSDQTLPVLEKVAEEIEYLWLDGLGLSPYTELATHRVQLTVTKREAHGIPA